MKTTLLFGSLLVLSQQALAADNAGTLTAVSSKDPITIDGQMESAWSAAEPVVVEVKETPYKPNNGYEGMQQTEVSIRALHDQEHIYFLLEYPDPTHSLERFPWVQQADGSWKSLSNKDDTGHENTYYEDKVGIFWNINEKGFKKKGCDKSCHIKEKGLVDGVEDSSAGRHFTKPGETLDMWHWKSARTNPVGQMDDQYVNSDRNESKSWGRHSDHKTGGGYTKNVNKTKDAPAFMNGEESEANRYWVLDKGKKPVGGEMVEGRVVGGMVLAPSQGSRGDISAKGVWKDGKWTLEIKRALVTNGEHSTTQDVQFDDLGKAYLFGVTVFDNSQINHIYHKKPLVLTFQQ